MLKDLKTNLKSLKFGNDRPGGGSSNQPYIKKEIPEGEKSSIASTGGTDFILRGGILAPVKAAEDVGRLSLMFVDKGSLFLSKQELLSRISVKTEASFGSGYAGGALNAGVYLPSSTLAQAGSGFLGSHLNFLGLDPTSLSSGGLNDYDKVVKNKSTDQNRLVILTNKLVNPSVKETQTLIDIPQDFTQGIEGFEPQFQTQVEQEYNDPFNVLSYSGGPGSTLGVGKTDIRLAEHRVGRTLSQLKIGGFYNEDKYNYSIFTKEGGTPSIKFENASPQEGIYSKYKELTGVSVETNPLNLKQGTGKNNILLKNSNFFTENGYDYGVFSIVPVIGRHSEESFLKDWMNAPRPTGASHKYSELTGVGVNQLYDLITGSLSFIPAWDNSSYNPELQSANNSSTFTQLQIVEKEGIGKGGNVTLYPEDFRVKLLEGKTESRILSLSPNYTNKSIHTRVNLGDPGKKNQSDGSKNVYDYSISDFPVDKITSLEPYESTQAKDPQEINDLVQFRIAVLNNNPSSQNKAVYLHFRAFIDNMGDSYYANWNPITYVGRGDTLYNYESFTRNINMSFTIAAQSKAELIPMYKKLNYLASTLTPDYSSGGFMRGNILKLTIGGYVYEQPGFLTALNFEIPPESPWEIGINTEGNTDNTVRELPHVIKVTGFAFTPIHTFLPQKFDLSTKNQKYISLANRGGSIY